MLGFKQHIIVEQDNRSKSLLEGKGSRGPKVQGPRDPLGLGGPKVQERFDFFSVKCPCLVKISRLSVREYWNIFCYFLTGYRLESEQKAI